VLDCVSVAVTASFNKHGTLLAVGCNDGRVVVWDFMTRGIAKVISAHAHPVCSVRCVCVFNLRSAGFNLMKNFKLNRVYVCVFFE
jgi:WD40 repeat protein